MLNKQKGYNYPIICHNTNQYHIIEKDIYKFFITPQNKIDLINLFLITLVHLSILHYSFTVKFSMNGERDCHVIHRLLFVHLFKPQLTL